MSEGLGPPTAEQAELTPGVWDPRRVRDPVTRDRAALIGPPGSPLPVRTLVPDFELMEDDTFGSMLRWEVGRAVLSEDLSDVLWRFVELRDATDQAIVAFAGRYGVLSGTAAPEARRRRDLQGWNLAAGSEPLAAWRAVVAGLAAMLDLATALALRDDTDDDRHREEVVLAMHAVSTVQWLVAADRDAPLPRIVDAPRRWLAMDLDEVGPGAGPGTGSGGPSIAFLPRLRFSRSRRWSPA